MDEEIDLTLASESEASEAGDHAQPDVDRRAILEPVVGAVVDALGGFEGDVYVMGDDALGCLKDLRTLWRKDETDDERTVARLCWETRVLPNDLVPIVLQTAGKGLVEDKRAIACADLITAMTWPIDLAEELKELDDVLDQDADYTQLLRSHLHYKAALLKPGVMQAMFGIMLPPIAKPPKDRKPRDGQIANVVLHLVRNLAFIKDLPYNAHLSSDQVELSNLQSKLIRTLSDTNMIDLLLTIAANADNDPLFNSWNTLVLETIYLLFRGTSPNSLTTEQSKHGTQNLQKLLALEDRNRRDVGRKATSRHSRFGTTISVKLNPNKQSSARPDEDSVTPLVSDPSSSRSYILHRQAAIHTDSGTILDMSKRQKAKKVNKVDDLAAADNLSIDARRVLQHTASEFLQACFNPFLCGVLKDIRSERPKITEKDNLRLLYVTKWFLEFFLGMRSQEKDKMTGEERWTFGLIAEVTERSWIVWVLKRMREATEEKPKLWTELQAGIECLTQLLLLIDKMSSSMIADEALREAAELLQQQLIYNGEVLDIALTGLKSYKPGTQSLAYLDSSIHLAYALLRMLERWSKEQGGGTYVRKKSSKKRRKSKGPGEEEAIPDVEEVEEVSDEEVINETLFTFEAFEAKFAHFEITHTLLVYLARYREFTSSDNMRRVVNLLHRQAVKSKAEGLFFKVSTLELFKKILADQKALPREQPYKDLINLINFILRQFFKALSAEPFLAVEAFFPKNRGTWKQYSSWTPEDAAKHERETRGKDQQAPAEVQVKKGHSWSDQVGIAIANLVERDEEHLVKWTQEILSRVSTERTHILQEADPAKELESDDDELPLPQKPSAEALAKIEDAFIPYVSDEKAAAASKNQYLRLLFRLCKFSLREEEPGVIDEPEWYVPASVEVSDLQASLQVITQFLETPFDLQGKKASQLLSKKRRRRRRRSLSPDASDGDASGGEPRRKRKEKKKKEEETYKSAQFIEDSDAEYGDMEAFLVREKALRDRMQLLSEGAGPSRPPTMKPTGTKKRRKKRGTEGSAMKRHKGQSSPAVGEGDTDRQLIGPMTPDDQALGRDTDSEVSDASGTSDQPAHNLTPPSRPRPRPVPRRKPAPSSSPAPPKATSPISPPSSSPNNNRSDDERPTVPRPHRSKRLVLSDEDED